MHSSDIYDDAVVYDLIHERLSPADIPFYLQQIGGCNGTVLELGCGTARVTIPLAEHGYAVTGLEIDECMLKRGQEKASAKGVSIEWVHGDARNFDLGKKFDLILFPCNAIAHLLDNESVESCFSCVKRHLADDGKFILQMFNPSLSILTRDPNQRYPVAEYDDPSGKGHVVVTENNVYDRARQVNEIKWYFKFEKTGQEVVKIVPMRIFYPLELDSLLRHSGFEIICKYGGFDSSPFSSESPNQIPICKLKK